MFDPRKIDDLVQNLVAALPPGVHTMKQDLEKNFRAILQATFTKMDLVTREEFDAQIEVLQRTREKLENLEKQLATMQDSLK